MAVNRGQLPDRARGPAQAPDVEAVEADQLTRSLDLDVQLRLGLARRLVGRAVASDQRESLRARVEPMSAQTAPNAGR
jgi:hypothetical protein